MVGRVLPSLVGIGTNGMHCSASLGSKLTASSCFRVVPELSTTTTASTATTLPLFLPSICCVHLPVFPFFIAGFVLIEWPEEIQTASLFLLLYRVFAKESRESSWRLRTDTCVSVTSLDNVVHTLNPSHSGRSDQPSRMDHFCQVCVNRL